MRIARAFGFFNLMLIRYGLVSLDRAMRAPRRAFRRVTVSALVLADGAHAIDVDNRRTYDIAAGLMEKRVA